MTQLEENLDQLRGRVAAAAARAGRKESEVRIMAVSKTRTREEVLAAYALGLRLFGENRVQELREKFTAMPPDLELHLIGRLQSNKAGGAAAACACVQSIDKWETLTALDRGAVKAGRRLDFLLEIHLSGEESQSGIRDTVYFYELLEKLSQVQNLRLRGLMGIAPQGEPERIRRAFRSLAALGEEAKGRFPGLDFSVLSMGMSGDFEIAIEEGATLIRVGTLLFGERPGV
ncbi:MAG: YggS family pyridoxal phosphate-dependent enzyme [Spirochaetales bacterium]|jgi:pyridoxal phosphate enzyme (YggS family)|nr:YggS family pyridoxal phosphate-dependent enzyme [Spirochaetales bacterium]